LYTITLTSSECSLLFLEDLNGSSKIFNHLDAFQITLYALNISFLVGSNMSPRKKTTGKKPGFDPSCSSQQIGEVEIVGATYDDTYGLLEKDAKTMKWGEVTTCLRNQIS
jgi:hypothetical protein